MPDGDGVWIYDRTAKPMVHFGSPVDATVRLRPSDLPAETSPQPKSWQPKSAKWYYDKEGE